jgi:acyl carrier protein
MMPEVEDAVMELVIDAVSAELRVPRDGVTPDMDLALDLNADSLDALNIAVRLEKVFNIRIPDAALSECRTVRSIGQQVAVLTHAAAEPAAGGAAER